MNTVKPKSTFTKYRIAGLAVALVVSCLLSLVIWQAQSKAEATIRSALVQMAQELDIGLGLGEVSVNLIRLRPVASLHRLSLGVPERELALHSTDIDVSVRWSDLLSGNIRLHQVFINQASIGLHVENNGHNNWHELISKLLSIPSENTSEPPFRQFVVNNVKLTYDNQQLAHEGLLLANGTLSLEKQPTSSILELTGDINNYLFQASLTTGGTLAAENPNQTGDQSYVAKSQLLPEGLPIRIRAIFAEIELAMSARINPAFSPPAIVGNMQLTGSNSSQLLRDLKILKTGVSDVSAIVDFAASDDQLQIEHASVKLGASDLSGSLHINSEDRYGSNITGQFASNRLSIDELLGTGLEPLNAQFTQASKPKEAEKRFFSSHPFQPTAWFSGLQGNVEGVFNTISRGAMRIDQLAVNTSFDNNTMNLDVSSEQFAGGSLALQTRLTATENLQIGTRTSTVSLKMREVQLLDVLSLTGVSTSAGKGKVSGEGTFWLDGFSPSSVAASIDGGLFTIIEDGELDAMLVEMAGVDLMESIGLLVKRDLQQTAIRCAFFDIQANAGVIDLKDFIIDTDDSLFLAKGNVDLNDESLSLKFEPHPRDASFFAAPTALVISGTLTSPSMKPGKSLYSRIAIAGALAALAGPAAIVLPFIEIGRGGEPSSCVSLFSRQ